MKNKIKVRGHGSVSLWTDNNTSQNKKKTAQDIYNASLQRGVILLKTIDRHTYYFLKAKLFYN